MKSISRAIARSIRSRLNGRESTAASSSADPRHPPFASAPSSSSSSSSSTTSPGAAGAAARDLRRRIEEGADEAEADEDDDPSRPAGRRRHGRRRGMGGGTSMSTRLSHAGLPPPSYGDGDGDDSGDLLRGGGGSMKNSPLSPPIELATTYERPADGDYGPNGRVYSRSCNPTRRLLEDAMGRLETMAIIPRTPSDCCLDLDDDLPPEPIAAPTFAFSSGMAAVASLLLACESPTRVLLPSDVYHGVPTQLRSSLADRGVSYESVDMTKLDEVSRAIGRNVGSMTNDDGGGGGEGKGTLVVWMETPSNPLCRVTDIRAVCDVADEARAGAGTGGVRLLTVVDSTWAPPCVTLPLGLGADVVLHSGTKYLAGHSDALVGIASCSPRTADGVRTATRLGAVQTSVGAVASPLECWLTLRGLRTLHLRLGRQCGTAMKIAEYLSVHESVVACHYPGLTSHPQHGVARRQMRDSLFGGMLSFEVGSERMAMAVAGAVRVIRRATSLGGTETLIEHRASIEPRERRTSPPGLLRLSVGLEDADDLIDDLEVALAVASRVTKP